MTNMNYVEISSFATSNKKDFRKLLRAQSNKH